MTTVITFGTFDVLHVGHLRILNRARTLGDRLVVGVSTDELSISKKQRAPIYPLHERMQLLEALRVVDAVFAEESLELKRDYIREHNADIFVIGDDWAGKFDALSDICQVIYLPRTPGISTTATIEKIRD